MATSSDPTPFGPIGYIATGLGLALIGGVCFLYGTTPATIAGTVVLLIASVVLQIGVIGMGVQVALERRDHLAEAAARDHRPRA